MSKTKHWWNNDPVLQNTLYDFIYKGIAWLRRWADTSFDTRAVDCAKMLEKRGFRLGFEFTEFYDAPPFIQESFTHRIYYHPEQKMVTKLCVPLNKKSNWGYLSDFGGDIYAQRDGKPKGLLATTADIKYNNESGWAHTKDIRNGLFGWYDAILNATKPLTEIYPVGCATIVIGHMFNTNTQKNSTGFFLEQSVMKHLFMVSLQP